MNIMGTLVRVSSLVLITLLLMIYGSARADIEVNARLDTIILNDGTEIECLILMMSPTGVVIVETDAADPEKKKQRTLPRSSIRNIVVGERSARTEDLLTDVEFARKVVLGSGARKDESGDKKPANEKDGGAKRPASSRKPREKKKEAAEDANKGEEDDGGKPADAPKGAKPPDPETVVPDAPVVLPPPALPAKELIATYLGRYPDLQGPAQDLAGEQRIQEWLQNSRQPVDAVLNAYLGTTGDASKQSGQGKNTPSGRPLRRPLPDAGK